MRFILLDRIVSMEPGRCIHAVKTLAKSEELFLDHFPGFPVVPGVLLLEMMAQASAKCLHAEETDRGYSMLGQVNSATFREWVRPGQIVDIYANVVLSRESSPRPNAMSPSRRKHVPQPSCCSASCRAVRFLPSTVT